MIYSPAEQYGPMMIQPPRQFYQNASSFIQRPPHIQQMFGAPYSQSPPLMYGGNIFQDCQRAQLSAFGSNADGSGLSVPSFVEPRH